jgi:hypothetical protein
VRGLDHVRAGRVVVGRSLARLVFAWAAKRSHLSADQEVMSHFVRGLKKRQFEKCDITIRHSANCANSWEPEISLP